MLKFIRTLRKTIPMMAFFLAGITSTIAQVPPTNSEKDPAKQAREEAKAISEFLSNMLSGEAAAGGRNVKVAEVLDQAVAKLEADKAIPPARRAKLQRSLATSYRDLGLYRHAIALLEKVRAHHLAASGPEHPDTLEAMHELAKSYHAAGRLDEALKLQEEVLVLCRKVLGAEHPDTLAAMHELAMIYHQAGRWHEAIALLEKVLVLSRAVLGPEHARTLAAMAALARSYHATGRLDEALELQQEVLALSRKVLGPEHPRSLAAMAALANSYRDAGRPDEAIALLEEVLKLSRKLLGPKHPMTLEAAKEVASFQRDGDRRREHPQTVREMQHRGRLPDAAEALAPREEVLALCRKVFGPEHQLTLDTMTQLAIGYRVAGRYKEAIELEERALALKRKQASDHARRMIESLENLATCYEKTGRGAEARPLREEVAKLNAGREEGGRPEEKVPDTIKGAAEVKFRVPSFTFARIKYSEHGPNRRRARWNTDFPDADRNFSARLQKVTGLKTSKEGVVLELTDPELAEYPFIYLSEPGAIDLSPAEVKALRGYLLGGGFLMADDFWGTWERENFRMQLTKVFPNRKPVDLPLTHPVFRSYYDLEEKPQVPAFERALRGKDQGLAHELRTPGAEDAHYSGITNDKGRLMAILCHNTDLADGWEREGENVFYDREFVFPKAYPMGINIVVHALKK